MDTNNLIPASDLIPAPPWVLILLEQLTFLAHIIVVNALLGAAMLLIYRRIRHRYNGNIYEITEPVSAKLPALLALAINLGIAPLLFLQVLYGNLFYTSSVLMAFYWIMIIPVVILAYYAVHLHFKRFQSLPLTVSYLSAAIILLLYAAFMLVCNNSLMERPETWGAYFENRAGLILNIPWPVYIPRFLHFLFASLAVGGLFCAVTNEFRKDHGNKRVQAQTRRFLKIFGIGSMAQAAAGLWYLMAIPKDFMLNFIGYNILSSAILMTGIICGLCAILSAFSGRLKTTLALLGITLISMIATRYQLRTMYLADDFNISDLQVLPQYSAFVIFLLILAIGLAAVAYMIKVGIFSYDRRNKI